MTLNPLTQLKRRLAALAAVTLLCALSAGCGQVSKAADAAPAAPEVGADRDQHGCIGSAGYAWCAREARCVRPWELAQEKPSKGVVNTAESFAAYCAPSAASAASAAAQK